MRCLLLVVSFIGVPGCESESGEHYLDADRVEPDLAASTPTFESDPFGTVRMLTGLQRELFTRLGDPAQDPATLLSREFMLYDGADSLSWEYRRRLEPIARRDDYLTILAGRLPPEELSSDRFEVYRQYVGSVVIVSHLTGGGVNLTTWVNSGSWKARSITINPRPSDLERLERNSKPLLAR